MNFRAGAAIAAFIVTILAGCSGTSQSNLTPGNGGNPFGPIVAVPSGITSANALPLTKYAPSHDIYVADYGIKAVNEIPKACRFSSCVVPVGTGFSCPSFVSRDSFLDLYVSNTCDYNTAVYKLAPGCTSISCASTVPGDYLNPFGTVSDKHDNVYVADYSHGYVKKVPTGCQSNSCVVTLGGDAFVGPGYDPWDYGPSDVALDKQGNVFVASDYYVSEMPKNCHSASCVIRLGGGWGTPWSVSLDPSGNIYVDDRGSKEIKKMSPYCKSPSCVHVVIGGFNDPSWAKIDSSENIYVSDTGDGLVVEVPKGCGSLSCAVTIGGGFSQPLGLAVGP